MASLQRRFVSSQVLQTPMAPGSPLASLPSLGLEESLTDSDGELEFTLHSQPAYERCLVTPGEEGLACRTPSDEAGNTRFSFGTAHDPPAVSRRGPAPGSSAAALLADEGTLGRTPVLDLAAPVGCVSSSTQKLFPIFKPIKDYKHLYIVRHGESEYNAATGAAGTGWDDPLIFDAPLTKLGRLQAIKLRARLDSMGLPHDVCWVASPLSRAIETLLLACTGVERPASGWADLPSRLVVCRLVGAGCTRCSGC